MQEYFIYYFKETYVLDIEAILTKYPKPYVLLRNKNKTRPFLHIYLLTSKLILMVTSLGTNAVVVTRVHCISKTAAYRSKYYFAGFEKFQFLIQLFILVLPEASRSNIFYCINLSTKFS